MKATFSAIKKILTLPCSEASLLMSNSMDQKLTLVEWLALRGHFLACKTCPPALKQMRLVRSAARSLSPIPDETQDNQDGPTPLELLSESARQRIKQSLREANSPNDNTG